ncbi:uncharacterized protein LOC133831925 [Humulus lupulus]|uniref:uncharacterized protein LOC133831925 n=1 Tax=Humulus lupulus TaxID=3486 RepID=UPI002B413BBA|nr:uncharacterized protein LOC133831925 [Humulus lupulus]
MRNWLGKLPKYKYHPGGRPRGSTAARMAEQRAQQAQPRPKTNNGNGRPGGNTQNTARNNPTRNVPAGTGNNRAPLVARNDNPEPIRNNPKPVRANSSPSRPNNGRPPPSPVRHLPSPIRHPSPGREAPHPAPNGNRAEHQAPQRPSRSARSGSRDKNHRARPEHMGDHEALREAHRGHRAPQPSGSHMSRSQTTGREYKKNYLATIEPHKKNQRGMSAS